MPEKKYKPRVLGGQSGAYYAALGKRRRKKEQDMDSSEYWAERAKAKRK